MIHALNPFGFAHLRRANEDNVDLNRNFVDHEGGNYPENDLFARSAEGFGGSGIQIGLLRDANAPAPAGDCALMLVHAVNPYGFAWIRRVGVA